MTEQSIERKDQDEKGYVCQYELHFLHGLVLTPSKPNVKIPIQVIICLGLIMLINITCIHGDTINVLDVLKNYGFPAILLSSMSCTLLYRREIHNLSLTHVDSWGEFAKLEKETEEMTIKAKRWVHRFSRFYMLVFNSLGSMAYCIFHLGKCLYLEPSEPVDLLIFQCWTPLPLDTNWGFYCTFFCQSLIIMCTNVAFSRVFCYKIICLVAIGHQMRLIGSALSTLEQRVERLMREKRISKVIGDNNIHSMLEQGIKKCAMQFQTVYRAAVDATRLFRPVTSVVYHFGMWVICAIGVKLATEQQLFMKIRLFMLLNIILVNQYIYSVGSEHLRNEGEELRIKAYSCPWYKMPITCQKSILMMIISFIIDTETSMENFGKILNGSYYYISLLLTILSD